MDEDRTYSFQTGERNTFSVLDYVLFALLLCVSASIGLFYAIKDRKKQTTKDFLLAGGNMSAIPVALSLLASFMSAITLLGTPSEMYNYTTMYWWIGLGYLLTIGAAAHIYIPVFYRLRVTSVYQGNILTAYSAMTILVTFLFCNVKIGWNRKTLILINKWVTSPAGRNAQGDDTFLPTVKADTWPSSLLQRDKSMN